MDFIFFTLTQMNFTRHLAIQSHTATAPRVPTGGSKRLQEDEGSATL